MALIMVSIILYFNKISFCDVDKEVFKFASIRILGSATGFIFQIMSLELISVSKSVIVIYNPFVSAILSYMLIGERISKYDVVSFLICTVGVGFLTNPFSEKLSTWSEYIGIVLALVASIFFNIGYIALRKIRNTPVNSWIIVFMIMVTNCVVMPTFFLSYDVYKEHFTHYDD